MKNKNLILIIIFFFLTQFCYTAVYKQSPNSKIKIVILKMEGNRELNNKINLQLRKHSNTVSENEFKINISTKLNKNTISKDETGKITNYELIAISNFKINYKNQSHNISFKESLKIKSVDDAFEQRKYENIVKNNFASSIYEQLLFKLKTLQ